MSTTIGSPGHSASSGEAVGDRRRSDVVVISAGHSGLAAAALIKRAGLRVVVLERSGVGAMWRSRYERLHLHTHRLFSMLPGLRVSARRGPWIARDDMADYLERYAAHHGLEVRTGVSAERIERDGEGWRVETSEGPHVADQVVIATGYNNEAKLPGWADGGAFEGELLHGARYRNFEPYVGRDVLVVGIGNTGAEIAQDLAEHGAARVRIAVRTPPHVLPRNIGPMPMQANTIMIWRLPTAITDVVAKLVSRLLIGDLSRHGLATPADGIFGRHARQPDYVPLLDVGFVKQLKAGRIEVVPAVERLEGRDVVLADGSRIAPDAVIVATGYRRALEPLVGHLDVLGEDGGPRNPRGGEQQPQAPGLFFIGFTNQLNGGVWEHAWEARRVARAAAGRARLAA